MYRNWLLASLFIWEQFEEHFFSPTDIQDKRIDRSLANNEIKNKTTVTGKSNYHVH